MADFTATQHGKREILSHWLWAMPLILVVALLALSQIDLYPPRTDEFFSMYEAGWLESGPLSSLDVLHLLNQRSPDQTQLYFILAHYWGKWIGQDIALGRAFSVLSAVLALSMIYRLASDFAAPVAGLFAVTIAASNPFISFYFWYMRVYSLLILTAICVCWIYLRLAHARTRAKALDYVALFAACYLLANTHAMSALLFLALGAYHIIHIRKDRLWLYISITVAASLTLFAPQMAVLLTRGAEINYNLSLEYTGDGLQLFGHWLAANFAGCAPLLLPIVLAGHIAMIRTVGMTAAQPFFILVYYLIALVSLAQLTGVVTRGSLRVALVGFPLFALFVSCGLYGLYRTRKWLGLLALFWIAAGFAFHESRGWVQYTSQHSTYSEIIPWHAISRAAAKSEQRPAHIAGYKFDPFRLNWPTKFNDYPQNDFYFAIHGITVESIADVAGFDAFIMHRALTDPYIWLMYRQDLVTVEEASELEMKISAAHYVPCSHHELGIDTVLIEYHWRALDCAARAPVSTQETAQIEYEFHASALGADGETLLFVDRWTAMDDFPPEQYNLSHQLISANWENLAQLDLPLVNEGSLRQFSIDINDAPAGKYRLMAILYDNQTNERFDWIDNPSQPRYVLALADVEIPE